MNSKNSFKMAMLAASIALAMGSTAVMAATAPTAAQLPGAGKVALGAATGGTITTGAQTITFTGNTVINWGVASGATINATSQPGGFNVGSSANLGFTDSAAVGSSVLNVDVSGNPSQIFGALAMNVGGGNLYVANSNGIIVGATAQISGPAQVGLIANSRGTVGFDGTASDTSIEYQGAGGDVSVAKGATIDGATVLVSGGGVVNVDLSAFTSGAVTLNAGVKNSSSTLVNDNTAATLTAAGALGGASLASFASAGNASSSGTLNLGNARVDGTLINTGTMDLGTGFTLDGAVVNNKTMTQSANASMGSLVNNGAYTGGNFALFTTDGGITNGASMTGMGYVKIENGGDFVNNGQFASVSTLDVYGGGNVTNNGQATLGGWIDIWEGGNFTNAGTMSLGGNLWALNGSITNSGKLGVNSFVETGSDSAAGKGYTAGADYSITNTGTITGTNGLALSANSDNWGHHLGGTKNTSTGSVSNTGTLRLDAGNDLQLQAYNDVNLAGTVQAYNGTKYAALSAANSLSDLYIYAGDYDGSMLNTTGVATLATDIVTAGDAEVYGNQVKLMANLSAIDATGAPNGSIYIIAGDKSDTDYAVRVASGKTVLADTIEIDGDGAANPNVILQGTISGNELRFGYNSDGISDLFSGPTGSLVVTGSSPHVHIYFTGAVKAAPYLNNPGNFRYNYLSISAPDDQLYLDLNPVAYTTNGTSNGKSAVNLLVSGDVNLDSAVSATVHAGDSAVTGVANTPNTHLVLQASGNIEVGDGGDFYWPGYVYLGNVAADADGNALPGTLGLGTITTDGEFNNALPGDIAGASGIHFITQFPMTLGGDVVTNANAWVNFGTDLLTQAYASGTLAGSFFGGTQGAGTVVNYEELDASMFHTHAPVATK